jgi:putative spermidine/putrescine transport system ATP-binding protein
VRPEGDGVLNGTSQISIEAVTKKFPGLSEPAVDNVSIEVAAGEFLTFLGPSGSGKTTTLSMIAGLTPMTSGRIRLEGRDISSLKPHKRNLGVVFQHYALFPHMTVAKNIAFPLQQRGMAKSDIDRRVSEVLALVGLAAYGSRFPAQLSGGEQQRVAVARAVVYEPRALLMDEPLGALDKKLRDDLRREVARMHAELGMTFVFVTHDQEEALTLSDRIALFNKGRVEQIGRPDELYDHPATLFVANFLGESNCFQGLDGNDDQITVVRPERISLFAEHDTVPAGLRRVGGLVSDVVYAGDHHRIGLRFADGGTGSAMRLADGSDLPALPGQSVFAAWEPGHEARVPREDAP